MWWLGFEASFPASWSANTRGTIMPATATDSELDESDTYLFADVEENEDELEENELYLKTATLLYYVFL